MYHAIVRAQLRRGFDNINRGNYDAVVAAFARRHVHAFYGRHALAGTRHTIGEAKQWYARLARLLPDLKFEILSIAVRGWPWNTVVAVEWIDHFTVVGAKESNQGVHMFRIKWGKVVALAIHCDTQKLADVLRRKAEAGLEEARAEPIGRAF